MLGQRIVTALVLLALLLPSLAAASPLPFIGLTVLLIAAAGWEWSRLNGGQGAVATLGFGLVLALICVGAWRALDAGAGLQPLWWAAGVAWVIGGGLALRAGPAGWPRLPMPVRWLLGMAALTLAWLALAQARTIGVNFLLSTLCVVWMADIAAYFGGRAFGRRKLAPSISPGKSWAGVYSGVAGVLVLGFAWLAIDRQWALDSASLYTRLHQAHGTTGLVLSLVVLSGLSVVGDLFESLVKRAAGAKDSSGLLPGHGGVLDRIDALLPVLPTAMALAQV